MAVTKSITAPILQATEIDIDGVGKATCRELEDDDGSRKNRDGETDLKQIESLRHLHQSENRRK